MCKTKQYVFLCNDKNKLYNIIITAFIALIIQKYFDNTKYWLCPHIHSYKVLQPQKIDIHGQSCWNAAA